MFNQPLNIPKKGRQAEKSHTRDFLRVFLQFPIQICKSHSIPYVFNSSSIVAEIFHFQYLRSSIQASVKVRLVHSAEVAQKFHF